MKFAQLQMDISTNLRSYTRYHIKSFYVKHLIDLILDPFFIVDLYGFVGIARRYMPGLLSLGRKSALIETQELTRLYTGDYGGISHIRSVM